MAEYASLRTGLESSTVPGASRARAGKFPPRLSSPDGNNLKDSEFQVQVATKRGKKPERGRELSQWWFELLKLGWPGREGGAGGYSRQATVHGESLNRLSESGDRVSESVRRPFPAGRGGNRERSFA